MFKWLRAPRLTKSVAANIAGDIARKIVEENLSTKEVLVEIENILSQIIYSSDEFKKYKITNDEEKLIVRQSQYNLENYRDLIQKRIALMKYYTELREQGGHIKYSDETLLETLKYRRDTTLLNDFPDA